MSKLITTSAKMQCTLGASPMPLTVTSQLVAKAGSGLLATEMDKTPMVNIPSFGVCKAGSPPPPCVPSPTAWAMPSLLSKINGLKVLTQNSFCMCAKGGKISFTNTGMNTFAESK